MHMMVSMAFFLQSPGAQPTGSLLPDTMLANLAYILIMYHAVLGIRVAMSEKKFGLSLPLWQAIVTHAACLVVVVGLAMARHVIPFFGIIRWFLPGIGSFEAAWLFSGEKAKSLVEESHNSLGIVPAEPSAPVAAIASAPAAAASAAPSSSFMTSTGDDYEDFIQHMKAGKRPFRKPGVTVKQEFELWLAHRNKTQAAAAAAAAKMRTAPLGETVKA